MKKFLAGILVGVFLTVGGAYGYFEYFYVTPIGDIKGQKDHYDSREVRVKGTVGSRIAIPGLKGFMISDETGKMPVVTQQDLPDKGETLTIQGKVSTSVPGLVFIQIGEREELEPANEP